jgi:cation diffusion facilitator family transporter
VTQVPFKPPAATPGARSKSRLPIPVDPGGSESGLTVIIAFAANLLVAIAKTVAAMLTGSASMLAESAHSWADTGNEIFLVIANRRSRKPANEDHPLGHGREAYVWSMFAALGLFAAGATVSVTHGITELLHPTPGEDFIIGYVVLAISFLLEGTSFLQSARQAKKEAGRFERELVEHVLVTSDPTLRAVFAEDSAALIGLVIAGAGLAAHEITGSSAPDAIASILIGLLLGVVALVLINQNRKFLVGEVADPRVRTAVIAAMNAMPEIARVTYLRLEVVGPRQLSLVGDVDLTGDDKESRLAYRLRDLEAKLTQTPALVGAVLSLSAPDEPTLG